MSDSKDRLDELIARLREQGWRLTPQRMAVLQVLASSGDHPSVEQIYERVRSDFPMTSRATVYKTMTLLKEMDEALELGFGEGGSRYDGNRPDPHPHVICVECRNITDLELDGLGKLVEQVHGATGFQLVSHRLDFYGVCPQCQALESQ
jgi:Fur family peroxide stress response transcriptional regulator